MSVRVETWIVAFAEVGVHTDAAELGGLMGADGKRIAREIAERHGRPLSDHRAALRRRARRVTLFGERNTDPRPLPFARELLVACLGARIPWAIATSSQPAQTRASVAALDLPCAAPDRGRQPRDACQAGARPAPRGRRAAGCHGSRLLVRG